MSATHKEEVLPKNMTGRKHLRVFRLANKFFHLFIHVYCIITVVLQNHHKTIISITIIQWLDNTEMWEKIPAPLIFIITVPTRFVLRAFLRVLYTQNHNLTCFISPASGIAFFPSGQDLLKWRQTGEINVVVGCHLSIQSHQGDVKLHSWHSWVLEALVTIDAKHVKALLSRLREGQVVFPQTHLPAMQLIDIPDKSSYTHTQVHSVITGWSRPRHKNTPLEIN